MQSFFGLPIQYQVTKLELAALAVAVAVVDPPSQAVVSRNKVIAVCRK